MIDEEMGDLKKKGDQLILLWEEFCFKRSRRKNTRTDAFHRSQIEQKIKVANSMPSERRYLF
jgi:hypothetical protein